MNSNLSKESGRFLGTSEHSMRLPVSLQNPHLQKPSSGLGSNVFRNLPGL